MTSHNPLPRPLAFGYLRLLPILDDHRQAQLTKLLDTYAVDHGLTLAGVFVERRWLDVAAWDALVERCHVSGAQHIVIPTPSHLSRLPALRLAMELAVRESVGGQIHIARPKDHSIRTVRRFREPR